MKNLNFLGLPQIKKIKQTHKKPNCIRISIKYVIFLECEIDE